MTRMGGGRAVTVEVRGAGEEAAWSTEEPLCALESGPEGFARHLPPTGPRRRDKEASRLPPLPSPPGFLVNPAPRRALRLQRLQPGALGEREGPWSRRDFSPRTPARPGLPFPVPQFPTRLQGLKRRLFGPDCSPERGTGEAALAFSAATSLQG